MNKTTSQLEFDIDNNNGIYKIEAITDSEVYTRELPEGKLLNL